MKQPTYDSWNTFRIPPGFRLASRLASRQALARRHLAKKRVAKMRGIQMRVWPSQDFPEGSTWWFQICFIFIPIWGRFPIWLIFTRPHEGCGESFKNRKPIGEIRCCESQVWFLCGDVPGFSRVRLDGLWIPTSWKISREMFLLFIFVVFRFKRDVWDVWDVSWNFASIFSQVFFFVFIFRTMSWSFQFPGNTDTHCQGIPQCCDHHSEVMYPVRMIRKHAYMSNEKKPGCLGYVGDEILPSYMGIIL